MSTDPDPVPALNGWRGIELEDHTRVSVIAQWGYVRIAVADPAGGLAVIALDPANTKAVRDILYQAAADALAQRQPENDR
ncbi:hypothetical protein ACFROC_22940 [Nocardia tengchongensis]|uniref:hypothetical protein n=1 Tax=Nocardia tengchongensis TaxID=2055889 RepID=UPI003692205A